MNTKELILLFFELPRESDKHTIRASTKYIKEGLNLKYKDLYKAIREIGFKTGRMNNKHYILVSPTFHFAFHAFDMDSDSMTKRMSEFAKELYESAMILTASYSNMLPLGGEYK